MDIRILRLLPLMAFLAPLPVVYAEPAYRPSILSEASLKQSLAQVLAIPVTQIVEARGYDLNSATGVSGIVLGRYRENGQAWTFPVLGVFHACASGTCISLLRLGQAVQKCAPLALVDLEQPVTTVQSLEPVFLKMPVREPGRKARWPVLLIASDVQRNNPADDETTKRQRSGEGRVEQHLYLVSLREGNAPKLLHQRTLLERWPESGEHKGRPPPRVGRRIENLRLGHQGPDFVMSVTERDIDSQYSRCLRPKPVELHYRLVEMRFVALGDPSGAGPVLGGCR